MQTRSQELRDLAASLIYDDQQGKGESDECDRNSDSDRKGAFFHFIGPLPERKWVLAGRGCLSHAKERNVRLKFCILK